MPMEQLFPIVLLLGLLGVAVASDVRRHRIPNLLILVGLALGLAGQAYADGLGGLGNGLLGVLLGFALFLPFYALGGMAAGDVKLMAMVGSFLGPATVFWAAAFTLMAGSVLGILVLLRNKELGRFLQRYWAMAGLRSYIQAAPDDAARQRFPYALAILLGTLLSLFWQPIVP